MFQTDDKKLVELIRSLELDVLIDLNGYTYKNRVNVLEQDVLQYKYRG